MHRTVVRALAVLAFMSSDVLGQGSPPVQIRIGGRSPEGPYMVMECRDFMVNLAINWTQRVGAAGEKLRHLIYHVDGDKHLMLPVLDAGANWTGYASESAKAKSLVRAILASIRGDAIPIGVFPAGRHPVTGEWFDAFFPASDFRQAAMEVAKACGWDLEAPMPSAHEEDNVPPG